MRLKAVTLENFRGYKNRIVIPIQAGLTAVIGRNDVGKSSVLEALEIFFNNEIVKCDRGDLNVDSSSPLIKIGCVFNDLPSEVIVDETVPTTLQREYLLNQNGDLEIVKVFKCQATLSKPEINVYALHPSVTDLSNLLEQKIDDLKALGIRLGVDNQVTDRRKSALWREVIRTSVSDLRLEMTELSVNKFDSKAKSIWEKIETLLPTFALFKSDRESSDEDSEAKNPMQAAVKQALSQCQAEIEILEGKIMDQVVDVAKRTLEKLKEMDSTLADELKPNFKEKPKWTCNFSLESDRGVPVNKRGSGVRRLILLNFFRAEAEKKRLESSRSRVIYAIEEPETSLHPNFQLILVKALLELASHDDCQVLLTTHVPALAGMIPTSGIIFIDMNSDKQITVSYGTDEVIERAVKTLGILPEKEIAGARAVVLVEGPGDTCFLKHAATVFKLGAKVSHNFSDKKIVPIFTGGCSNLKHWITKKTAEELGIPYGVFLDSDKGAATDNTINMQLISALRQQGVKAHCTRKREAENYINPVAVSRLYQKNINFGDYDDAKLLISQAIGVKQAEIIEKVWLNMTESEIVAMDMFVNNGQQRNELVDIVNDFLSLVS